MKIIIVDDNQFFRENLKYFLEKKLQHEVIGEASGGIDFLGMTDLHRADIILMDIELGDITGIQAVQQSMMTCTKSRFIAVTMHIEKVFLKELIEAGFKGCVYKTEVFNVLDLAMHEVLEGKLYFPENIEIWQKNELQPDI